MKSKTPILIFGAAVFLALIAILANRGERRNAPAATGKLKIAFTRNTAATDLTLSVIAADSLTGPWTEIARSRNGAAFTAIAPGALVNETGTVTVKSVETTNIVLINNPAHLKRFMGLEVKR